MKMLRSSVTLTCIIGQLLSLRYKQNSRFFSGRPARDENSYTAIQLSLLLLSVIGQACLFVCQDVLNAFLPFG